MDGFLRFFASRSFLARVLTAIVLMIGAGSLSVISLQEYPDVAFAEVEITTIYPGASAQDIELNITNKIEKELKIVEGITKYNSTSSDGRSYINVELDESYDLNKTVRDIQQAVDRVDGLPKDIKNPPIVTQKSTSSLEVMTFGVVGGDGAEDLQRYSRDLEKQLRGLSGVGNVVMSGFKEREYWVEVDPTKIARYGLAISDVSDAVQSRNLSLSGGLVESWSEDHRIVTITQVASPEELAETIVAILPSGEVVRISDVAMVNDTFERASSLGMINGLPSVLFTVYKGAGADIVGTIDRVKALLEKEKVRSNGTYAFPISLNLSDDMDDKFSIVTSNGGVGLLLVLLVLSLILKRRVALWVAVSIPFCILGVIAVIPAFGMSLDSITLAALLLVIGIIVDDSVIVAESIYQEIEGGRSGVDAAVHGTKRVLVPIIASLSTTALVFIPMMFIPGTMGKAISVIPITVISALLFSLFECTFTLPAHLAKSFSESEKEKGGTDWFSPVGESYRRIITSCLNRRKTVASLAVLAMGSGIAASSTLKVDIFPSETARLIEVRTEVEPGTPLERVREANAPLEKSVFGIEGAEALSFHMVYGSPVSTGLIRLNGYEDRDITASEVAEQLTEATKGVDSLRFVKFNVDAGGPPPGEPLEVRVISGYQPERNEAVEAVVDWMKRHEALSKVTHNEMLTDPQVKIVPQYDWLARYGLTVSDLAQTLRVAFDGDSVTSTWLGDEEVDIRVILSEQFRGIDKLMTTKIYTPSGEQVSLSRLAKVEHIDAPREILHYGGDRQVVVTAQINEEMTTSSEISSELISALASEVDASVRLEVGGEAESTGETMSGFFVAFPMAIVAIYLVLAIMFSSLTQPLIVMAVIPFAAMSAMVALFVHMEPISLFALVGVLGMTGVVVNNSLVLVNRINELRAEGKSGQDSVIEASYSRFRPIILTSVTTVVGLIPLAYGLGGTDSYMGPMSLTLGYGLLFSLPVVLIVIPCCYMSFFVGGDIPPGKDKK